LAICRLTSASQKRCSDSSTGWARWWLIAARRFGAACSLAWRLAAKYLSLSIFAACSQGVGH
jgi:hypothetical protein